MGLGIRVSWSRVLRKRWRMRVRSGVAGASIVGGWASADARRHGDRLLARRRRRARAHAWMVDLAGVRERSKIETGYAWRFEAEATVGERCLVARLFRVERSCLWMHWSCQELNNAMIVSEADEGGVGVCSLCGRHRVDVVVRLEWRPFLDADVARGDGAIGARKVVADLASRALF